MISRRSSNVPKEDVVFPACFTVFRGAPRCFQACHRCSQACRRCFQSCRWHSHVLPGAPKVLSSAPRCSQTYHNHSNGTPVPVISDPSSSDDLPECPPRVWYSPQIDASKFTLHIHSDTPGGFQWLKYILLMHVEVLESKWRGKTVNTFDFYLQVTIKRQCKSYISVEIY